MAKHRNKDRPGYKCPSIPESQQIQIGDTIYDLDGVFLLGMKDARDGVPYNCNPIRESSEQAHNQWSDGHTIQCELMD